MFRSRPLAVAVLCTAALAACSDSTATGADRGSDPLVNATNQNLGAEIVFDATRSETVTPGAGAVQGGGAMEPASLCPQIPLMAEGSGELSNAYCYPYEEPYDPYYPPPPPPVTPPTFAYPVATITGSSYAGTKTVNLNASGGFTYASFGQLTAIFQNVGGCPTTAPSEYSRSTVNAQNAPFTLSASRSASYNGTTTVIKWGVRATSYAESPEGGSATKTGTRTFCY
jgi:hypothetical protein